MVKIVNEVAVVMAYRSDSSPPTTVNMHWLLDEVVVNCEDWFEFLHLLASISFFFYQTIELNVDGLRQKREKTQAGTNWELKSKTLTKL